MAKQDNESLVKSFEDLGQEMFGMDFSGDEVVQNLAKAMATNSGLVGAGDATPLRLENLDGTMTEVLHTEAHLKVWKSIPRVPSAQEIYQWIRRVRYGQVRRSPGFRQGGAPYGGSSKWNREFTTVKWLGVRGGYTHQLQVTGEMGGMFVDPVAEENRNRTMEFMEQVERASIFADKNIQDEAGNEVMYDGFMNQVAAGPSYCVIDMQGKPMDFNVLEQITENLVTKGRLLDLSDFKTFFTPFVLTDLARLKLDAERVQLTAGQRAQLAGYSPGTPLDGFRTQHGYLAFDESIFLEEVQDSIPNAVADPSAPAKPADADITLGHTGSDGNIPAATYYYSVASMNDKGESDIRTKGTGVAVAAHEHATVTVTNGTGVTAYRFYRGLKSDGSDASYVGTVAVGSGTTVFTDTNQRMPGTGFMIGMNLNPRDIAIAQMAPLIKFPLAVVSTTIEFLLLLYHVLVVKAAERMVVVKNIGRR
jgi:hypothetical protein